MELKCTVTQEADLETFFLFQTDEEANQMAAFTAEDPWDKAAYMKKWTAIVHNDQINMQSIRMDGQLVGSVLHFTMDGNTYVSYWIGRQYWGRGIASKALQLFLQTTGIRPLLAQVAYDNYGSQRVLEKCGFVKVATEKGYANARKTEIEEFVYKLL